MKWTAASTPYSSRPKHFNQEIPMENPTIERIEKEIKSHKVVLFVKGTPEAPQCGFSASTMELFRELDVPFHTVDVIANADIRRTLPQFSSWPTFPQVFIS